MSVVNSVRSWLAPEDRVLSHLAENTSQLAHEREELTCLWMGPYLTRFLKSESTTLSFSGKPGSGKTVLASVIVDRLQDQIGGVTYKTLFVPISKLLHRPVVPFWLISDLNLDRCTDSSRDFFRCHRKDHSLPAFREAHW